MSEKDSNAVRIKSAASLLTKGGTLTNDPCPKCGGVQVRFGDKITCINCGNEEKIGGTQQQQQKAVTKQEVQEGGGEAAGKKPSVQALSSSTLSGLAYAASQIEEKIALTAAEIRNESDILILKQKAELIECYLRILEKARVLAG